MTLIKELGGHLPVLQEDAQLAALPAPLAIHLADLVQGAGKDRQSRTNDQHCYDEESQHLASGLEGEARGTKAGGTASETDLTKAGEAGNHNRISNTEGGGCSTYGCPPPPPLQPFCGTARAFSLRVEWLGGLV